jgi:predicted NAD-dependent protein-ADP-ribosyltransferase YbiA (DUF1768 family)
MNKLVYYEINENIEKEDIGIDSPTYSVELYDKEYLIALGAFRTSTKKNTYYFPMYLIHEGLVFKQIGVFEFESSESNKTNLIKPFLDKDGDIDIRKLQDPLLYPFADREFFEKSTFAVSKSIISDLENDYARKHGNKDNVGNDMTAVGNDMAADVGVGDNDVDVDNDDEDDLFSLPESNATPELSKIQKSLLHGIFEHDPSIPPPPHLTEETKADAIELKKEFNLSKSNQWIEEFMRNNQYDIVETASNGDCLFDAIRIAFLQIGHRTTIAKLRAMVAEEADEELFKYYRELYLNHVAEKEDLRRSMQTLKKEHADTKKRLDKMDAVSKKKEMKDIKPHLEEISKKYKNYAEILRENESNDDFNFMKDIGSLEQLRQYIQKSAYWADEWSIGVLERKLNIKLIVFAEDKFKTGDLNWILENNPTKKDPVFQCTPAEVNNPHYYIMTSYTGSHYRLITYKTKYILTFAEIPFDVKIMIVIKCMEKRSGAYSLIASFRHFQTKYGVPTIPVEELYAAADDSADSDLYDASTVFMFYNKSSPTPKPGKGSGEEIPVGKMAEYSQLTLKQNNNWRRKLDDEWPCEFKMDQLRWYSVEHYYQGSKFKKMHPEFYRMFSLDSGSDFAEDVEMARIAGSNTDTNEKAKKANAKAQKIRPADIKVDPDFYGERQLQEREKAVFAKFSQNADLGEILSLTKNAKLVKYIAKKPAEIDLILMKVRQVVENQKR